MHGSSYKIIVTVNEIKREYPLNDGNLEQNLQEVACLFDARKPFNLKVQVICATQGCVGEAKFQLCPVPSNLARALEKENQTPEMFVLHTALTAAQSS